MFPFIWWGEFPLVSVYTPLTVPSFAAPPMAGTLRYRGIAQIALNSSAKNYSTS